MAHHHQRDLINNDDATTDRLKLPVHTPPPPHTSVVAAATTTGTMPSPLALPPPAIEPAVSPRDASNQEPFQLQRPDNATPPAGLQEATLSPAPDAAATASSPIAPSPARCSSCRKRLGLAGFRCRCGSLFCAVHRYSDRHTCTFDYKAQAREAIARDNPAYKAPKLLKI